MVPCDDWNRACRSWISQKLSMGLIEINPQHNRLAQYLLL